MVLDSYTKYDGVLVGIGLMIAIMIPAIILSPTAVMVAGIIGLALMGYALFWNPPTVIDRKI